MKRGSTPEKAAARKPGRRKVIGSTASEAFGNPFVEIEPDGAGRGRNEAARGIPSPRGGTTGDSFASEGFAGADSFLLLNTPLTDSARRSVERQVTSFAAF